MPIIYFLIDCRFSCNVNILINGLQVGLELGRYQYIISGLKVGLEVECLYCIIIGLYISLEEREDGHHLLVG